MQFAPQKSDIHYFRLSFFSPKNGGIFFIITDKLLKITKNKKINKISESNSNLKIMTVIMTFLKSPKSHFFINILLVISLVIKFNTG